MTAQLRFAFLAGLVAVLLCGVWLTGSALNEPLAAAHWRTAWSGLWTAIGVLLALICPWAALSGRAAATASARALFAALAVLANALPAAMIVHLTTAMPLTGLAVALLVPAVGVGLAAAAVPPAMRHAAPMLRGLATAILQILGITGIFLLKAPLFALAGL